VTPCFAKDNRPNVTTQVAYLMADVSQVRYEEIKNINESLEGLSSRIMTRVLY
jgi:Tat protein secretion system quality control protein TatD with DNase activity